jgi:uncharacterized membrane protein YecN with MAPEG domain
MSTSVISPAIPMQVTLVSAAAFMGLNIWLGARIAAYRRDYRVSVGDGGHEPLLRRMRAQANFIENAPFVLITIAALEMAGSRQIIIAILSAAFVLVRIAHAIGMDRAELRRWRMVGMIGSTLVTIALIGWALVCAAVLSFA